MAGNISAGIDDSAVKVIYFQVERPIHHHRTDGVYCYITAITDETTLGRIDIGHQSRRACGAPNCEMDIPAVVDLPIFILNKRLKITRSQIAADVHANVSTCSDVRALVPYAQTRRISRRIVSVIARDVECDIAAI